MNVANRNAPVGRLPDRHEREPLYAEALRPTAYAVRLLASNR